MTSYAIATSVPIERTKGEIERLLIRAGASEVATGWSLPAGEASVGFMLRRRRILMRLKFPAEKDFAVTPRGRMRSGPQAKAHAEQEMRRRWRALLLVVKAKLEAVSSGIATIENEFLAYTLLPDGTTVGSWAGTQLDRAMSEGQITKLLGDGR